MASGAADRKETKSTHSVQAGLSAGEREGEAQRKRSVLHAHVVQEVADALNNVVKQLQEDIYDRTLKQSHEQRMATILRPLLQVYLYSSNLE